MHEFINGLEKALEIIKSHEEFFGSTMDTRLIKEHIENEIKNKENEFLINGNLEE